MWLWWAPLGAAVLHIVEEFFYPGGFAEWDRRYRPVVRVSITRRFHVIINGALLLACIQIGILGTASGADARAIGTALWLAIAALLFSNAVFHVVGSIRTRTRSPGVVTGVVLYVPLAVVGYTYFLRSGYASFPTAVVAAVIGGSYPMWAALMHRARARGRLAP
jgi:Protein of unknown function with HXXEE motif